MILAGVVITLLGFLVSVMSVALTASVGGRMAVVTAGLAISLFGVLGVLNRAYLRNAIWKR